MAPDHKQKMVDEILGGTGLSLWLKMHDFIGNYEDKVESWWGSQWI